MKGETLRIWQPCAICDGLVEVPTFTTKRPTCPGCQFEARR